MNRAEQLKVVAEHELQSRFTKEAEQIVSIIEKQSNKLIIELSETLEDLFTITGALQNKGVKGIVSYICFSHLYSNLLLENFEFRVDAYDEHFYLDDSEASVDWSFASLVQSFPRDIGMVETNIRKSMVRVQNYEIYEITKMYQQNYFIVVLQLLLKILPYSIELLSKTEVNLAEEVQFTFGPYMEEHLPFYTWRTGL